VMNDVLLAPQEWMTMQTAVDGATLLQQQTEAQQAMYNLIIISYSPIPIRRLV